MVERREFKRLPAEVQINIRSVDRGELKQSTGKNISGGGILLSANTRYETGQLLDIEVITATHRTFTRIFRPMLARVRVVRVEGQNPPFDIAAEFLEVER
jgi:hypothetical protein